jgi:formylglycine-generating enzyme required for sulfatase activity
MPVPTKIILMILGVFGFGYAAFVGVKVFSTLQGRLPNLPSFSTRLLQESLPSVTPSSTPSPQEDFPGETPSFTPSLQDSLPSETPSLTPSLQATSTPEAWVAIDQEVSKIQATLTAQAGISGTLAAYANQLNATLTVLVPTQTITPTPTQEPQSGATQVSPIDGMVTVYIPSGVFTMGGAPKYHILREDERPTRAIFLDGYWIDRTPVTFAMYYRCFKAGGCTDLVHSSDANPHYGDPEYDDHPVVYVTWFQAADYCKWVGGNLPTEAQWVKAARGESARVYPWGNDDPETKYLNYNREQGGSTKVGSFPAGASPYGVLDMAGNVREWVNDWYSYYYYSGSPASNPPGPETGTDKVQRGGSWQEEAWTLRVDNRSSSNPNYLNELDGFRCAATP